MTIPKCPYGNMQLPNPNAKGFMDSLFCLKRKEFINPDGDACRPCISGKLDRKDLTKCVPCKEKLLAKMKAQAQVIKPDTRKKLLIGHHLCVGDVAVFTAAVRDFVKAYGDNYLVDIDVPWEGLFRNNPWVTSFPRPNGWKQAMEKSKKEEIPVEVGDVVVLYAHYHDIGDLGKSAHYILGFLHYIEYQLHLPRIPLTDIKPDIHITQAEWDAKPMVADNYWIIDAGVKPDGRAKIWPTQYWQQVVDHYRGKLRFVQIGCRQHWHPRLNGVEDLVGKTDLRQLIMLVAKSQGCVCPVTALVHIAAGIGMTPMGRRIPCVVIAGGSEPSYWAHYRQHQYLHTDQAMSCSCWSYNKCAHTIPFPNLFRSGYFSENTVPIPQCRARILPEDVYGAMRRLGV